MIGTCIENKIAVYSPHTSWDSVPGGVNDWLASAFGRFNVSNLKYLLDLWALITKCLVPHNSYVSPVSLDIYFPVDTLTLNNYFQMLVK